MEYRVVYEHRAWQSYDEPLKTHDLLEDAVAHLVEVYNADAKIAAMDTPDVALLVFKDSHQIFRFGYPYMKPQDVPVLMYIKEQLSALP